jgi:membrane protein
MSTGVLQKLDRAQQRSTTLSVAVATFKKFSDDQSANLAAMIAFWAFFSVFPLFLVLVTQSGVSKPDQQPGLGVLQVPGGVSLDERGHGDIV